MIGVESFVTRGDDLGLAQSFFGDVANIGDEERALPRRRLRDRHLYWEDATILVDHLKLSAASVCNLRHTGLAESHEPFPMRRAVGGRDQQADIVPALRRLVGDPEYLFG
ncbi:hypothetical protein XMM354_003341 [Aliiroseovarius sp. xm-m-354]|nr:hypothetical protein [Aliiroseovarius sp. xm-m-354]